MINFIARFKFLVSFIAAIIVALAPSLYKEYNFDKHKTNIIFSYDSFEDLGLTILRSKYPHLGSFLTLKEKYINIVKNKFQNKKYTLSAVMKNPKTQIPMDIAVTLLKKIHVSTIEVIERPYIAKFTILNKSGKTITIKKLTISTDDAYSDPVWDVYFDFPNEKFCNLKKTLTNCAGYLFEFEREMILPSNTKFQLFIFFPDMPFIKLNHSFAQVRLNGSTDDLSIALQSEMKVDTLKLYLNFTIRIILAFFVILGLAYLFLMIQNERRKQK